VSNEQLNHPCAGVCSGWKQGFERGLSDREYHGPSGAMIIEENKRLKAELAESLANEQSRAKAYAESQAREAALRNLLYRHYFSIGMITLCSPCNELNKDTTQTFMTGAKLELSLPDSDLVGVIKVLSEALEDIADGSEERGTVETANWVLNMTREIRERIGAV